MTTNSIVMMCIVLTFFWGGFTGLIIRLQKISKAQTLEEEKTKER